MVSGRKINQRETPVCFKSGTILHLARFFCLTAIKFIAANSGGNWRPIV